MSFNFNFRFAEDEKDIGKIIKFLEARPFNYPNYLNWVCRVKEELLVGYKQGIFAVSDDGVLVGDLIFQPHKDFPGNFLELKNLRIHEKIQGRYFGVFMLKQAEVEARGNYQGIVCDVRSDNLSVAGLLKFMGYQELFRAPIYGKNAEDIVFGKSFKINRGIFVPVKKKILERSF